MIFDAILQVLWSFRVSASRADPYQLLSSSWAVQLELTKRCSFTPELSPDVVLTESRRLPLQSNGLPHQGLELSNPHDQTSSISISISYGEEYFPL